VTAEAVRDRFLCWPALLAVAFPLACALAWAGRVILPALFASTILTLWAGAIAFAVTMCAVWIYEQAWRRFVSTLVLPLAALMAVLYIDLVCPGNSRAGDYIHLFAAYPYYLDEISKLPEPRFALWRWSGSTPCNTGLAYDEGDTILADPISDDWKERTKNLRLDLHVEARAFGHFYFVDIC
jgi:hypothetical protein